MVEQIDWERLRQAGIPFASADVIVTKLIKDYSAEARQMAFGVLVSVPNIIRSLLLVSRDNGQET